MEELNAQIEHKPIELKKSRTGSMVPVVDSIYLHSIYNPAKEAQAFAANYRDSVKEKSNILILGLGFGYHVKEIASLARGFHKNYKIVVYEPNQNLIDLFNDNGGFEDSNVEIVHAKNPIEVFERIGFIMFLTSKPAIIRHEASYSLNKDFFRSFLTFKAPTKMASYQRLMSEEARKLFPVKETSTEHALDSIKKAGRLHSEKDYAFFVLEAVVNSSKQKIKR